VAKVEWPGPYDSTLWSIYGFGTEYFSQRELRPDGSYVTTEFLTALDIPLVPLGSQRVREVGPASFGPGSVGWTSQQQYGVRAVPTNWRQVLNVYLGAIGLLIVRRPVRRGRWGARQPRFFARTRRVRRRLGRLLPRSRGLLSTSGEHYSPGSSRLSHWYDSRARSMMRRMVRAQRPHCALQPRQWYTCPVVLGTSSRAESLSRTSWSVNTLQEQIIIANHQLPKHVGE
jgi:hypothetical protein